MTMVGIGPRGQRALPHPWWTPVRLALALATVMFALTVVAKTPCAEGAWWSPPRDDANLCASRLPAEYAIGGLAEGVPALSTSDGRFQTSASSAPQAVLSYVVGQATRVLSGWPDSAERQSVSIDDVAAMPRVRAEAVVYVGLAALLQLLALLAIVRWCIDLVPARQAFALAGAPLLVFAGLVGWDLVPAALAVGAIRLWHLRRPVPAGAVLGVAVAWAFWPIALAVAFLAVGLRQHDRSAVGRSLTVAFGVFVALGVVAAALTGGASNEFYLSWLGSAAGDGSLAAVAAALGVDVTASLLTLVVLCVGSLLVLAVFARAVRARHAPSVSAVAVAALVAMLVVQKSVEPGYALWLLPLAVLAYPDVPGRMRDLLVWQGCEILFIVASWWHSGEFTYGLSGHDPVYLLAICLRVAAELWLAWRLLTPRSYVADGVPARG